MKIITGLFTKNDVVTAVYSLIENGFDHDDISLMSTAAQMPDYLEKAQEEPATTGTAVESVNAGVSFGTLGIEAMILIGLMNIRAANKIGDYLGSIGRIIHTETQKQIDIHEELQSGKVLLLLKVNANEDKEKMAEVLIKDCEGEHIKSHHIPLPVEAEVEAAKNG